MAAPEETRVAKDEIKVKSSVHITVTKEAAKIITMEEAEMLVKFVWPEIIKAGGQNSFTVPKLGLSIVRDGDELFIMTIAEKEAALGQKEEKKTEKIEKQNVAEKKKEEK